MTKNTLVSIFSIFVLNCVFCPLGGAKERPNVVFKRAYAQVQLCGPSRASIMTSELATTHGCRGRMSDEKVQQRGEEMGTSTMPEFFKDNGYHVMAVGKLFHRHVPEGSVGESGERGSWNTHPAGKQKYNGGKTLTDWAAWPREESEMADYQTADWAVEKLKNEYEEPFMLMVGFLRPHVLWIVPQRWFVTRNVCGKGSRPTARDFGGTIDRLYQASRIVPGTQLLQI